MNDPTDHWRATVARIYQEAVKELEAEGGVQRQEAFLLAQGRVSQLVEVGELRIDHTEAIRHELYRADDDLGKQGDRAIERLASGQGEFILDGDPLLNTVVILGGGRRKTWAKVKVNDLREMDALRYENFRAASDAYDRWRRGYAVVLDKIGRHGDIGSAVAAGAFDPPTEVAS